MASAAAGGNGGGGGAGGGTGGGKQSSTGLMSAMASLNPFGKSKAGGKGGANSGSNRGNRGSHSSNETVPRSYGLNGGLASSNSDHSTGEGGEVDQQQQLQGSSGDTRR